MNEQTSRDAEPLIHFAGFNNTPWEVEYRRAIVQIAARVAVDRKSAFDRLTIVDAVSRAIDHRRAQLDIVRGFVELICDTLNDELHLGMSVEVTECDRGVVYGCVTRSLADHEMLATVGRILEARCGRVPRFAASLEGSYLFEWLLGCLEVIEIADHDHDPRGSFEDELANHFRGGNSISRSVQDALDLKQVNDLLRNPMEAVFAGMRR
jgi:hypothetical protein